ncbi:Tryptophan--tRNA ligase 2 [Corynebacterium provencense]|uniref:Tryptophan--tRNA ligase n=1 Tax=Corynebacterium provencense TaxID=1737425 RepID=A0A2Z3YMG9_9CORY|nr:tryptophan--tRNA ligase [Corynebacterium provencense]AWT25246.1 Tryptophan--tRNA ligase 2 [Corynebacterium provencense]
MTNNASLTAARRRSDRLRQLIDSTAPADAPARGRLRVLTGDRPTGALHIGHYLGTVRSRVELQDKGIDTFLLIADYQVITDRDSLGDLQGNVRGVLADYLAAGIDPARTTIFAHSAVPAANQLMLPFLSLVTEAELHRNPTVKDELAATDGRAMSGLLLTYPVHQACDILFCHGNVVPVGQDQLPHIEQARVIARRFNERYAGGEQVFTEPEALLTDAPMITGTDGRKMSKSRGNTVPLGATADETAKILRRAVTDAERRITFEPERRPEVANLLTVAAGFTGGDPRDIAEEIGDAGAGELKRVVTEAVNDHLAGHRARRAELLADPGYLMSVLREGNERANEVADATLTRVREVMGMLY